MNNFASQFKKLLAIALIIISFIDVSLPVMAVEILKQVDGAYGADLKSINGADIVTNLTNARITNTQSVSTLIWNSLNTAPGQSLKYVFPTAFGNNQLSLNKVEGVGISRFAGSLTSEGNGRIIISNPNGILFENGSYTNVNALTLTTQQVTLLNNELRFFDSPASIGAIRIGGVGNTNNAAVMRIADDLNIVSNGIKISNADILAGNNIRLLTTDGVTFLADSGAIKEGSILATNANAKTYSAPDSEGTSTPSTIVVQDSILAVKDNSNGKISFIAKGNEANVTVVNSAVDGTVNLNTDGNSELEVAGNLKIENSHVGGKLTAKTIDKTINLKGNNVVNFDGPLTLAQYLYELGYSKEEINTLEFRVVLGKILGGNLDRTELSHILANHLNDPYKTVLTTHTCLTEALVSGKGDLSIANTTVLDDAILSGANVNIDNLTANNINVKSSASSGVNINISGDKTISTVTTDSKWDSNADKFVAQSPVNASRIVHILPDKTSSQSSSSGSMDLTAITTKKGNLTANAASDLIVSGIDIKGDASLTSTSSKVVLQSQSGFNKDSNNVSGQLTVNAATSAEISKTISASLSANAASISIASSDVKGMTNLTATSDDITITRSTLGDTIANAAKNITISDNSNINGSTANAEKNILKAGSDINVNGSSTINNSALTASNGGVTVNSSSLNNSILNAKNDITVSDSTASGYLTATSANGKIDLTNVSGSGKNGENRANATLMTSETGNIIIKNSKLGDTTLGKNDSTAPIVVGNTVISDNSILGSLTANVAGISITNSSVLGDTIANSTRDVQIIQSNLAGSGVGKADITAVGNIVSDSSYFGNLIANAAGIDIHDSEIYGTAGLTATSGNIDLANINSICQTASGDITANASGYINISGSILGNTDATAKDNVTVSNFSTLDGLIANGKSISVSNSNVKGTAGLTSNSGDITISNSSILGNTTANSANDVQIIQSNLAGSGVAKTDITAAGNIVSDYSYFGNLIAKAAGIDIHDSDIYGTAGLTATKGNIDLTNINSFIQAASGDITANASGYVNISGSILGNTNATAGENVTVSNFSNFNNLVANGKNISVTNSTVKEGPNANNLTASVGDINITNSTLGDTIANAAGNIIISNNSTINGSTANFATNILKAGNNINVTGNSTVNNSILTANNDMTIDSSSLNGSNLSAGNDVNVKNNSYINNSKLAAVGNNVSIADSTLTSSRILANNNIKINKSTTNNLTLNANNNINVSKTVSSGYLKATAENGNISLENVIGNRGNKANATLTTTKSGDINITNSRLAAATSNSAGDMTILNSALGNTDANVANKLSILNSSNLGTVKAFAADIDVNNSDIDGGNLNASNNINIKNSSTINNSTLNADRNIEINNSIFKNSVATTGNDINISNSANISGSNLNAGNDMNIKNNSHVNNSKLAAVGNNINIKNSTINSSKVLANNDVNINNSTIGNLTLNANNNINVSKTSAEGYLTSTTQNGNINLDNVIGVRGNRVNATLTTVNNGNINITNSRLADTTANSVGAINISGSTLADTHASAGGNVDISNGSTLGSLIASAAGISIADSTIKGTDTLLTANVNDINITNSALNNTSFNSAGDVKISNSTLGTTNITSGYDTNIDNNSVLGITNIASGHDTGIDDSVLAVATIKSGNDTIIYGSSLGTASIVSGNETGIYGSSIGTTTIDSGNTGIYSSTLGDTTIGSANSVEIYDSSLNSLLVNSIGNIDVVDSNILTNAKLATKGDITLAGIYVENDLDITNANNVLISNSKSSPPKNYHTIADFINGKIPFSDYNRSRFNNSYFDGIASGFGPDYGAGTRISYIGGNTNISNVNNFTAINTAFKGDLNENNIINDTSLITSYVGGNYNTDRATIGIGKNGGDISTYKSYVDGTYTDYYPDQDNLDSLTNLNDISKSKYGSQLDTAFRQQFNPRGFAASDYDVNQMKKGTLLSLTKGNKANSLKFSKGFFAY